MTYRRDTPIGDLTNEQLEEVIADRNKPKPRTVVKELYVHGESDSLYHEGLEMGMSEDAASTFSRTFYEIGFSCRVDIEDGSVEVRSVDVGDGKGHRALMEPDQSET